MNKIETTIEINANPDSVWQVFSDFDSYPKWSSFIESIKGEIKVGAKLTVLMKLPGKAKGATFSPEAIAVIKIKILLLVILRLLGLNIKC